jgi:hypothetical protein
MNNPDEIRRARNGLDRPEKIAGDSVQARGGVLLYDMPDPICDPTASQTTVPLGGAPFFRYHALIVQTNLERPGYDTYGYSGAECRQKYGC